LPHTIRTEQGLLPGLRAGTCLVDQVEGAGEEPVEGLHGHLDLPALGQGHLDRLAAGLGVGPQGSQEVAQAAFCGEEAILEAKALGVIGVAGVVQVLQGLAARPGVSDLPALQKEQGDRVAGAPATGRGPTQELSQASS